MIHDNRDNKTKTWCEWVEYTVTHLKEIIHYKLSDRMNLIQHLRQCTPCKIKVDSIPNDPRPRKYPKHLEN